jgi:hypothetical protein
MFSLFCGKQINRMSEFFLSIERKIKEFPFSSLKEAI